MINVFIGGEALAQGTLTRGQLRWNYRSIFPNVYLAKGITPLLEHRAEGAWLWSGRKGVVAGVAAAALHGARPVEESPPVELIWRRSRPPQGIVVRNEHLPSDEITYVDGIAVTTHQRTALDLARHLPRDLAVSHLDALAQASGISTSDVLPLVDRHYGARGVRRAVVALSLMNGGACSVRETRLRLALIDGGLCAPQTRIKVADEDATAFIEIGFEHPMVGIVCGARVPEILERTGWTIVRAKQTDTPQFVVHRVRSEIVRRGYLRSGLPRRRSA
jgi:hypothetical protein